MGIRNRTGVAVARSSYPSGAWIDSYGNPAPSPNKNYQEINNPNPDPNNYKILKAEEINNFTILEILYPNCTNYEGRKILLFKAKLLDIINQKFIDPHFFENKKLISPIARFIPNKDGWNMAILLAKNLK
jgi:hypothetical protein